MAHSPWQRDVGTPLNLAQVYESLGLESDEASHMLSVVCPCHSMLIIDSGAITDFLRAKRTPG